MSDTKYNFDEYIFDNVLEDTYLAIKDVRENIDTWVKETREIDFDYNPYEGCDEREKLDGVITKNIVNSIKDRLYTVDFENKVMRGVNVEAVRSVVGRDDFSNFFRPSQILKDSVDPEVAVQLMPPMDSVRYCYMHGDLEYPVEFSELMFTADMSLSDKTRETIDKVCENFEWNEVTQAESMSADMVRGRRKTFVEPECENDGSDIELGD